MSDANIPPEAPEPPPLRPPAQRDGCLTAFMIIAGIVLLLPGLCTLLIGAGQLSSPGVAPIATVTFSIGMVGLILIVFAIIRR